MPEGLRSTSKNSSAFNSMASSSFAANGLATDLQRKTEISEISETPSMEDKELEMEDKELETPSMEDKVLEPPSRLKSHVKEIVQMLKNHATDIVLTGKAGVGKTWIAKEVCRCAREKWKCYATIWIYLDQVHDETSLYESIVCQLPTGADEWQGYGKDTEEQEITVEGLKKEIKAKLDDEMEADDYLLLVLDGEGNKMKKDDILCLKTVLDRKHIKVLRTRRESKGTITEEVIEVKPLLGREAVNLLQMGRMFPVSSGFKILCGAVEKLDNVLPIDIIMLLGALNCIAEQNAGATKVEDGATKVEDAMIAAANGLSEFLEGPLAGKDAGVSKFEAALNAAPNGLTELLRCAVEVLEANEIQGFDDYPTGIEDVLKQAECVLLVDNKFLSCISDLHPENLKGMKSCWLERCTEVKSIYEEQYTDLKLGEKMEFAENLEILRISTLPKLRSFYEGKAQPFSNLKELYIDYCPMLETVFSSKQVLENLETLQIKFCAILKAVFGQSKTPDGSMQFATARKLKHLYICHCPGLETVFSSNQILENLETLQIKFCGILNTVFGKGKAPDGSVQFASAKLETVEIKLCDKLESVFGSEESATSELLKLSKMDLSELPELRTIGVKLPNCVPPGGDVINCPKLLSPENSKPTNASEEITEVGDH
ncbi:hypothetical protein SLEP1_g9189 [Rubroshorea leprosula]|uniref:NB-ARC domain-containing protein n=1 Tax=Rubroshorea leprosula TaxID=152421 RepID=A0AAV5I8N7_9ROSI|nr:hypothetical protein SLEP1_g9189 [Rubroshorea leprosula]